MKTANVTDGIYLLTADVENILFEGIWPVPEGVSLNSYIVKGEKTALIDGVCDWDGVPETLYELLDGINIKIEDIDYVILNHLEPDHSGWLVNFKKLRSDFAVYTTDKGAKMLEAFYGITENVHIMKSGSSLDLGGRILKFFEIPNIHWPETMAAWDEKTGTLLPCDAFGSFGSLKETFFDDQLSEKEFAFFENETLRYYANIVAAFSIFVERAIDKLGDLNIKIIAPGHGIIWRKDPGRVIELYKRLASYRNGPGEPEITLIWGSMYGNTEAAVQTAIDGIENEGVKVNLFRTPDDHESFSLASAWKSTGIVLGMPTYEYRMFPPMAHLLDDFRRKKVFGKKAFRFGSHGWSGGAQKELEEITEKMNWDFLDPVDFNGKPRKDDLDKIYKQAKKLARQVKELSRRNPLAKANR